MDDIFIELNNRLDAEEGIIIEDEIESQPMSENSVIELFEDVVKARATFKEALTHKKDQFAAYSLCKRAHHSIESTLAQLTSECMQASINETTTWLIQNSDSSTIKYVELKETRVCVFSGQPAYYEISVTANKLKAYIETQMYETVGYKEYTPETKKFHTAKKSLKRFMMLCYIGNFLRLDNNVYDKFLDTDKLLAHFNEVREKLKSYL